MPPSSFVAVALPSYSVATVALITFNVPLTAQPGDTLLVVATGTASPFDTTALAAAGWSLTRVTTGTGKADVARLVLGKSIPSTITLTGAANADYPAVMLVYRGLDPFAPITAATLDIVAGTAFIAPSIPLMTYSDLVVTVATTAASRTFTAAASTTKRSGNVQAINSTVYTVASGDSHPEIVGAGPTAARQLTASGVSNGVAVGILLGALPAPLIVPFGNPGTKGALGLPPVGV